MGGTGDPVQFIWFLRWVPWALLHGHTSLLSTQIVYPDGVNFMWQPGLTLPAALMTPITLAAGPVVSYNLLTTAAPALAGLTGYFFLCRFVRHRFPALIGGLAYGFSPFLIAHNSAGHLFLSLGAALVPWTALLLHEAWIRQRWSVVGTGIALGVIETATLLTAEEILAVSALTAVIAAIILAAFDYRRVLAALPRAGWTMAVALLTFVVLSGYPLYVQFYGPRRLSTKGIHAPDYYVTDFYELFLPRHELGAGLANGATSGFTGNLDESNGYWGIPLVIIVVIILVRRWHRRSVRATGIIALIITLLSLGPHLHTGGAIHHNIPLPWALVAKLPFFADALPSRIMLIADLFLALLVAMFVDEVRLDGWRRWTTYPATLVVACFALSWTPITAPYSSLPQPDFFTSGASQLRFGEVMLVVPFQSASFYNSAMLWQAISGMDWRMPDGYVLTPRPEDLPGAGPTYGLEPNTLTSALVTIENGGTVQQTPEVRDQMRADLQKMGIEAAVVGPMPYADKAVDLLTWVIGTKPVITGGVWFWAKV